MSQHSCSKMDKSFGELGFSINSVHNVASLTKTRVPPERFDNAGGFGQIEWQIGISFCPFCGTKLRD